jgi:hypothetical protein
MIVEECVMEEGKSNLTIGAYQGAEPIARSSESLLWRAFYLICVITLSVVYFRSAIEVSSYKHLWMDEILAVTAATQSTLAEVRGAIWAGTDFSPPLFHYFLHALSHYTEVFSAPLTYRIPSILSVYAAAWLVHLLVRRHLHAASALAAFALILVSNLFDFAVQARQYGALSMDLAAALFIWDGFHRTRYPSISAVALWAVLSAGLYLHFYGFVSTVAIGICEALFLMTGGRIRWRIWLALVLTIPVELSLRPLAAHLASLNAGDNRAHNYYAHPSIGALSETLWKVLLGGNVGVLVIVMAAFVGVSVLLAKRSPWVARKLQALEREIGPAPDSDRQQYQIMLASLLVLPFIVFAFSLFITHSFSYRYAVAGTLFFGMACAYLLDQLKCKGAITLLLMPVIVCMLVGRGRLKDEIANEIADLRQIPSGLPIIVENGRDYIELMGASDNPVKDRLYFLNYGPEYVSPDPTNQHAAKRMAVFDKNYKVVDSRIFLAEQGEFYLFTTPEHGTREGFLPWLFDGSMIASPVMSGEFATVSRIRKANN